MHKWERVIRATFHLLSLLLLRLLSLARARHQSSLATLLKAQAPHLVSERSKCPFVPQREMESKLGKIPEASNELTLEPVDEAEWQPPETSMADEPLALPRSWGHSTSRPEFNDGTQISSVEEKIRGTLRGD
jgi:hypothetical protein